MKLKLDDTPTKWFGDNDFGGCFLADAFTLSCEDLKEDYLRLINDKDFLNKCENLINDFSQSDIYFVKYKKLILTNIDVNYKSLIIQAMMAKEIDKNKIVSSIKYFNEAIAITEVCKFLDIPLKLYLSKELSNISSLINYLTISNVEFNTDYCEELFNLPGMYAFQDWVGAPDEIFLLNIRSNIGAFPFPAMSANINSIYGEDIINLWSENNSKKADTVVVPCISGTTALSIFKPLLGDDINLISVEIDNEMVEERDSYCGAFTLVRRDKHSDRVISPELAYLWKSGKVERIFISKEKASKELKNLQKDSISCSLESAAAVAYAKKLAKNNIMTIIGKQRAGMVV